MKTLEAQRARYLKTVEAAGSVEVMESVRELESNTRLLNIDRCKKALSDIYIRTGAFPTYSPMECVTQDVYCSVKTHARVKEYFEQRNSGFSVSCYPPGDEDRTGTCNAKFRCEPLFEKNK